MATTYQGPHASVTQQFVTSPGAVAVEDLPSVAVATAYNVYQKEALGSFYGLLTTTLDWGTTGVIFDETVADKRTYDMYPVVAYANTRLGYVELEDLTIDTDGIDILVDTSYDIPGTVKTAADCQAILPYYKATTTVKILATDLSTVVITNGSVVTAQIKPGEDVWVNDTTWIKVGTVASVGDDETKVKLAVPHSAAIAAGTDIVIGADEDILDSPNILFDSSADFVKNKVAPGDLVSLSSLSVSGSIALPLVASVVSIINSNTLKINTVIAEAGQSIYNFARYKWIFTDDDNKTTTPLEPGSTIKIYSYSIKRLLGFSQSFGLKDKTTGTGTNPSATTANSFTANFSGFTIPQKGDIVMATLTNMGEATDEMAAVSYADGRLYKADTVTHVSASIYTITTIDTIYLASESADTAIGTGSFIHMFRPKLETEIDADFRSVRSEENGVVKRITSVQDIFTNWVRTEETTIDPRNELAFMMNIILSRTGGKVCYGVNVDSTVDNLSGEYAVALEALKMYDVYSHSFGTTNPGVNALIGPYCDEQAAPYEAHERIGIITYDTNDLFLIGSGTGTISNATTGKIVLDGGTFFAQQAGVTAGDYADIYGDDGVFNSRCTVTTVIDDLNIQTDSALGSTSDQTFKFISNRKDDQAVRVGAVEYGNRRVSMIFPGWFSADYNGSTMLVPPYFIAATIAGMDGGIIASQSLTNMPFAVPGLSNFQLNTSTFYRKAQLDEMGGGGVDIMIQDAATTQTIKSRHDLTTDMSAVQYRERSITKQADVAAKTIRAAVTPYVGRYNINDPNLFRFLGQVCSIVCTTLTKNGVLAKCSVIRIVRDDVIDDKINFFMEATAFIAGNYYDITLLIKTR